LESFRVSKNQENNLIFRFTAKPNKKEPVLKNNLASGVALEIDGNPIENKANFRAIELVSKWLGVPKSRLRLVKGQKSQIKEILIENFDLEQLESCLKKSL